ncbi:unnamed protein product [Lupinus luteus]|uniref:F-box protein n=1 Tax=Lupinus luteus TaxID=3873 RepID=A0AAV1WIN2_LUPLU
MEVANPMNTQLKRVCSDRFTSISESSCLEALPSDILFSIAVKVLFGVDHEDLERLFLVSRTIKEAAEMAEQLHFKYSTPKKKTASAFHMLIDVDDAKGFEETEVPYVKKSRSRLTGRNLDSISANLFPSMDEEL